MIITACKSKWSVYIQFEKTTWILHKMKLYDMLVWSPNREIGTSKSRGHDTWSFSGHVHIPVPVSGLLASSLFLPSVYIKDNTTKKSAEAWYYASRSQNNLCTWSSSFLPNPKCHASNPPHSRVYHCYSLKFPEPVKLHLCMAGSPSVLIGLSSPVLRSHQCLFGVEAFLCLKLFTQLDLVGNLRGSPVHI